MKKLFLILFATLALQAWSVNVAYDNTDMDNREVVGSEEDEISLAVNLDVSGIAIDETNFPDDNFRQYVLNKIDTNGDARLQQTEIDAVTEINVSSKQIGSLKGLEYFTKLTNLDCTYNSLTSLDVSMLPDLEELSCNNNNLSSLDVTHNTKLSGLGFRHNNLKSIDLSKNSELYIVNAADNQLTWLDVTRNFKMQAIFCSNNKLTSLNLSNNPKLTILSCFANQLNSLDLTYNPLVNRIELCGNQLRGDAMDRLVASLPTVNGTGRFIAYSDDPQDNEGNEFQPRNALNLMLKNWTNITYVNQDGSYPYAIEITEERFPDAAFRARVCSQYDTNSDGWLQVSEMATVDGLSCENLDAVSLKGIEFFPKIVNLWAGFNQLTTLDLSGNPLVRNVQVYQNQLVGNGVNELIASLPSLPVPSDMASAQGTICAIMNTDELHDANDFGMAQVASANAKGWSVREYYPPYNAWSLYDGSEFIIFEDSSTEAYCVEHFDTNGDHKLSYAEAAAVRPSQLSFKTDADGVLVHFDEFQYFTGLAYLPDQCFLNVNRLQTITLPNTLKSVSKEAFRYCPQLQRVTLQEGIKSIRNDAFNGCTQLTTIKLPASLDSIGQNAFNTCRELASVEYAGNSIKTVGAYAFQNCYDLTSFPFERVECIEAKAFCGTGLTEVTTNAYHIGRGAFEVSRPITITLLQNYFNTIDNQPYENQKGLHLPITSATPAQGTLVRVDRRIFHDAYNATTTAHECLQPYIKLNALEHYEPYEQFDDQGSDAVPFSCELPVVLPQGSRIYIVTGLGYDENNGQGKAVTRAIPGNVVPANTGVIVKLPGRDIAQEQYWNLTVAPDATSTGNYSGNLLGAAVGPIDLETSGYMLFEWYAQFYNGEYYYSFMTNMDAMWADGCTAFLRMPLSQTPSGETGGEAYALDLKTLGDVTGDGSADVGDVNAIINVMLGRSNVHDFVGNPDVTGEGDVDVADVNKVINIMLGKE